ncbi:squalene--hopene cyclase [Sorangium sp. So ce118]
MTPELRTAMDTAMTRAVRHLLSAQDARGAWRDFLLPAGNSDVWVTAFVGYALATAPVPGAREAAMAAFAFLERAAGPEGGFSYNRNVPGDGDSTLWGLRLAEALGLAGSPCALGAAAFLERHMRADGGVATYASAAPVRRYIGLPPAISFEGWTRSHVCVTAAAANLPAYSERLRDHLLRHQAEDGRWPAYWWFDDEYATAEAVAALAQLGGGDPEIACRIERAARWALGRAADLEAAEPLASSAFAAAHGLRVLARAGCTERVSHALASGLSRLLGWQEQSGAFPASARLRVPRPDVDVPDPRLGWALWTGERSGPPSLAAVLERTFTTYSLDQGAVYTTATVLRALQEIRLLVERG